MRYNENGLFPALEKVLKAASEPLDCQVLYDMPEIREHAASVNRVSDYFGGLWRKGLVVRLPAPKNENSRSRWMYEWKGHKGPALRGIEHTPRILADRPSVLITEDGNLIIAIRQKN